jgi:hypothetical protein
MNPEGGKVIFNFIGMILGSAVKSSPDMTPTETAEQQGNEIDNYKEKYGLRSMFLFFRRLDGTGGVARLV